MHGKQGYKLYILSGNLYQLGLAQPANDVNTRKVTRQQRESAACRVMTGPLACAFAFPRPLQERECACVYARLSDTLGQFDSNTD